MVFDHSVIVSMLFVNTIILTALAVFISNRPSFYGKTYLISLIIASSIWSISYAFEELTFNISIKILWSKISYLGIVTSAPFLLLFVLHFCGIVKNLKVKYQFVYWVLPIMFLIAAFTNELHHLVWFPVTEVQNEFSGRVYYNHGIIAIAMALYSYLLLITGLFIIIRTVSISHHLFRRQLIALLVAVIIPWGGNLFYLIEQTLVNYDITPLFFSISGVIIALSIKRYKFLDITPIAKHSLFDGMSDGVLVLDRSNRIVDFNFSLKSFIGISTADIGRKIVDVTSIEQKISFQLMETSERSTEIYTEKENSRFWINIRMNKIFNDKNELIGTLHIFENITDRKNVELSLQASEKKYSELSTLLRLLADNMTDMLWAKNIEKKYIFANKAICENLLNASDTFEPIGKTDMYFAERERSSHKDNPEWHTFGEICRDSDSITLEEMKPMQFNEFGNVKGKFLFLDVHKAPLLDENGNIIGVVGSGRDVTERKIVEEELQIKNWAIESSINAIALSDLAGKLTYVNSSFLKLWGYESKQEVINRSSIEFWNSNLEPSFVINVLMQKGKWQGEMVALRKDGSFFEAEVSANVIYDLHGKPLCMQASFIDISEQKRAIQELTFSEELNRKLLLTIPDIVLQTDLEGIITYVNNPVLPDYPEISSDKLLGKSIFSFVAPKDLERVKTNSLLMLEKPLGIIEYTLCFEDLYKLECEVNAEVIRDSVNNPKGIVIVIRDVTKRKKIVEELRESEERNLALLKALPDMLFVFNKYGYFIDYSCNNPKELFLHPKGFLNKHISEVLPIEVASLTLGKLEEVLNTKQTQYFEYSLAIENFIKYYEARMVNIGIDRALCIIRDVTENKDSEEKLFAAQSNMKAIIENTLDSIWSINNNYEIVHINEAFAQAFNAVFGVLLKPGSNIYQSLPPELQPIWKEKYDRGLGGERYVFIETIEIGGGKIYIEVAVNPIYNDDKVVGASFFGRDISTKKQIEDKLLDTQTNLTATIENTIESIWSIDKNYKITYINNVFSKAYQIAFGVELKEGFNVLLGLPENIYPIWKERYDRVLNGERYVVEDIVNTNNSDTFIEVAFNPIIRNDEIIGASMTGRDITEQKNSELALKNSEAKYRALYESMPNGYYRSTPDGYFVDANPAFIRMLGYDSLNELKKIHIPTELYVKNSEREDILTSNPELKNQYESYRLRTKSGEIVWIEDTARYVKDDEGRVIFHEGFCKNVSDRKKAEDRLKESENKYRLLAENSSDFIYVYNFIPEPYYEYISPSCLNLLGYEPEVGYNDPFAYHKFLVNPEDIVRLTNFLFDPTKPKTIEEKWRKKDGTVIWVEQSISRNFDENGNLVSIQSTVRNITERKIVEEELRKSSEKLEVLTANIPSVAFQFYSRKNGEMGVYYAAGKIEEMLAIVYDEQVFNRFVEKIHPNSIKSFYECLNHSLTNFVPLNFEGRYIKSDKDTIWIKIHALPFKESPEKIFNGIILDITEQKKSEEYLTITKDTYLSIFNSISESIYVMNYDYTFLDVNKGAEIMYGYTKSELIGKTLLDLSAQGLNDIDSFIKSINEVFRTGISINVEFWGTRKNGQIFPKEVIINKGTYFGKECIISTARDITERKKFENEINLQSNLRELLVEISSGFINVPLEEFDKAVNRSLEKLGSFVKADRAYIFEYDWANELTNNTYEWCAVGISTQLQNLKNLPLNLMEEMVKFHKKNEPFFVADVYSLPHGPGRELVELQDVKSMITVPMINNDTCTGFVGFDFVLSHHEYNIAETHLLKIFAQMIVNMKLRKEIFEQLVIAKEKAEEMNKIKSSFFANMSHELRTPFVGILGFAELLSETLKDPKEKSMANGILKASARMQENLSRILGLAKLESDSFVIMNKKINVHELIINIYDMFSGGALHKNIIFEKDIHFDELIIESDGSLIKDILQNLVSNAIKFTYNGEIKITSEVINKKKTNLLTISVKDTGIGIPKEKHAIIWEPFRQASEGLDRDYEGTGLGLSIVKKSVELLKGNVYLDSEKGKGSTFTLELPITIISDKSKKVKSKNEITDNWIIGKKILHVDDDEFSRAIVSEFLVDLCDLETVTSAVESLEKVKIKVFDAVLMDINLKSSITGVDLTQEIRKLKGYSNTPIIAITAYASEEDRDRFLSQGLTHYIAKPFKKIELLKLLNAIFKEKE